MSSFAIAGLQLEVPNGDNTVKVVEEINAAMARFPWLDMIVLPELCVYGTDKGQAQALPGPFDERFAEIARQHKIWLLPGSVYERDGDHLYNTATVFSPQGVVVTRHRKIFPWTPYETGVTSGDQHTVFDIPGVARFGVSICYDMWFPETVRALAWKGAEIILHPDLTSSIDRAAEHAMIRAHAAQNQVYFFDVNLADPVGVGESLIAGPGGEVIYQAGKGREIMPLKLNLDYLRDVRRHGWQNLGQPIKSFRDSQARFPQYEDGHDSEALMALGELRMPKRGEGR